MASGQRIFALRDSHLPASHLAEGGLGEGLDELEAGWGCVEGELGLGPAADDVEGRRVGRVGGHDDGGHGGSPLLIRSTDDCHLGDLPMGSTHELQLVQGNSCVAPASRNRL